MKWNDEMKSDSADWIYLSERKFVLREFVCIVCIEFVSFAICT